MNYGLSMYVSPFFTPHVGEECHGGTEGRPERHWEGKHTPKWSWFYDQESRKLAAFMAVHLSNRLSPDVNHQFKTQCRVEPTRYIEYRSHTMALQESHLRIKKCLGVAWQGKPQEKFPYLADRQKLGDGPAEWLEHFYVFSNSREHGPTPA